jgi:Protein of unknown function (DUF1566)
MQRVRMRRVIGTFQCLVGVTVLALSLAGLASRTEAAIINACVKQEHGEVRIVAPGTACKNNEDAVTWNSTGDTGAPGATGPAGPAGADGAAGTAWTPPCFDADKRFKNCGDGTVFDKTTGLMWEKKQTCSEAVDHRNPHCYLNTYSWSAASPWIAPTGTLYTDFLAKLNLVFTDDSTKTCFANHCDWRIPTLAELKTIVSCTTVPCIDSIFGPTQASSYWSSTSYAGSPADARGVDFSGDGFVGAGSGSDSNFVRAVRGGM